MYPERRVRDPSQPLLSLLTRVSLKIALERRGLIVGYNNGTTTRLTGASLETAQVILAYIATLDVALHTNYIESMIESSRYPYIVLWDGGWKEIYGYTDLHLLPTDPPPPCPL